MQDVPQKIDTLKNRKSIVFVSFFWGLLVRKYMHRSRRTAKLLKREFRVVMLLSNIKALLLCYTAPRKTPEKTPAKKDPRIQRVLTDVSSLRKFMLYKYLCLKMTIYIHQNVLETNCKSLNYSL